MGFKLFTTKTCAYCPMLKKYLDMRGASYELVDVTDDAETRLALQKKYNITTVPFLLRDDGEFVAGYNLQKTASMI